MEGSVIPPFSERQPFDPLCLFIRYKQGNEDILSNICLLSQFAHQIEDDKMIYELTEYQENKIIISKNFQ